MTYLEGEMDTLCKSGFTTKTLPDYEESKVILWDPSNTKVFLGDNSLYFDTIYAKDNCKLKSCNIVQNSNNQETTQITNNFEVLLDSSLYKWSITKTDVTGGVTFPDYKMKCVVDINLGGAGATTHTFYGNKVSVK